MVEKIDDKWSQTETLMFYNAGPVNPGAKTRVFNVSSRISGMKLGSIKWYAPWRQYCCVFHPGTVQDKRSLLDTVDFLGFINKNHRRKVLENRKPFRHKIKLDKSVQV